MQTVLKFSSSRPVVSRSLKLLLKAAEQPRQSKFLGRPFRPFPTPIKALRIQDPTGLRRLPFSFLRISLRRTMQSF
jgi:hypothetical protein